ncbi:carboxylesterase family protein [Pseudochryseolinea flava]|uniref:Phospholipase n=1 Tax=Pseudochryseolinea flava TaxID=2059302 RepID=A0A364Y4H9_9BACT|nr:alpha/beta hydrolase-fold protein [Pseudochryseolinea flava]RAW00715.1 phospholipase [Pseudochryseolinea flava]
MKLFLRTLLLTLLCAAGAAAQTLPSGPQVVTFFSDADDTEQPYGLYIPKNYDANKKYPLVIMLHGAGSNHRLALRRVFGKSNAAGETDVEATRYFPEWKDVDYIVASPYARGTAGYQGIAEKDVLDVLADVKKRFNIDEDRTYLTGLSMGGGGTLWIGMTRPDIWAAIAPVCPAPPNGTDALMMNAHNLPAHFFHGDADPAVKVDISRTWVKTLQESGATVAYAEYPGVFHDSWVNAYKDGFIFDWFSKFKRNLFPDQVKYATTQYKFNHAYWITIDQLTPGTLNSIDAKFTDVNKVTITTKTLNGFTLTPDGHSKFKKSEPLEILINGKKIKAPASAVFHFKFENGKWLSGKIPSEATSKKQGAEGPISAAFSSRHIYVFGTGGNPSPEELKNRVALANQAANWSEYRNAFLGRIMFFPRIVADREVRPSDLESSNLILFGTAETNSVIAKYSDRLPITLNNNALSDHGLFYVFPIDGHYVAINSGLPWWTNVQPQGFPFLPAPYLSLGGFKDFLLFKNSGANVIADGYFDHQWKFDENATKKLKDSGAVTIK